MCRLSLAVAVIFLGSIAVGQDNATEKDLKSFQGTWKIVSMMRDGKEVEGKVEDTTAVISGKEITLTFGKEDYHVIFQLDATKKPPAVDMGIAGQKGFPNKGIYELKGDMLTLCWGGDGAPRPTKLISTKEGHERLLVLQRIKK
jgi:uncharacterized protein (TIGR03067 family)